MKSEDRIITRIYIKVLVITWLLGLTFLIIWRRMSLTTLLYEQFLVITFLILVFSYILFIKLFSKIDLNRTSIEKFAMSLLISILFFSTIQYSVLTVDRSRSLYLLKWVEDGRIKLDNGNVVIVGIVKPEMKVLAAVAQRIQENKFRGLITKQLNGMQQLTFLGRVHLTIAYVLAKTFKLNGWYENT